MTRNRRIGMVGTFTTIQSEVYKDALGAVPRLSVIQQACSRFVEFVEREVAIGTELEVVACEYLQPLKGAEVDAVTLGCTYYPLLTGVVARVMRERVSLVTSSEVITSVAYNELADRGLLHVPWARGQESAHESLTAGESDDFPCLAYCFSDPEATRV